METPDDGVNVSFSQPRQAEPHHTGTCLLTVLKTSKCSPTCVPTMLKIREVELEEVSGDERERHQPVDNF